MQGPRNGRARSGDPCRRQMTRNRQTIELQIFGHGDSTPTPASSPPRTKRRDGNDHITCCVCLKLINSTIRVLYQSRPPHLWKGTMTAGWSSCSVSLPVQSMEKNDTYPTEKNDTNKQQEGSNVKKNHWTTAHLSLDSLPRSDNVLKVLLFRRIRIY